MKAKVNITTTQRRDVLALAAKMLLGAGGHYRDAEDHIVHEDGRLVTVEDAKAKLLRLATWVSRGRQVNPPKTVAAGVLADYEGYIVKLPALPVKGANHEAEA